MIRAVVYNHNGEITSVRSGSEASVMKHMTGKQYLITTENCAPETHYVKDEKIKPYPEKPHDVCVWDNHTESWQTPLDPMREHKWLEIKHLRNIAEQGGFEYDGNIYDSDPISQNRILGAAQWASLDSSLVLEWMTSENQLVELNAEKIQELAKALGQHIVHCHNTARQKKQEIELASTVEEIQAIEYT